MKKKIYLENRSKSIFCITEGCLHNKNLYILVRKTS